MTENTYPRFEGKGTLAPTCEWCGLCILPGTRHKNGWQGDCRCCLQVDVVEDGGGMHGEDA